MILLRAGFSKVLRNSWQTVLAVIGVALKVGVVTAVDLAVTTTGNNAKK